MHTLEQTQRIEAPPSRVFEFFSDPGNLARITPAAMRFRIVDAPSGGLTEGSRIEYRIRWLVFPIRWVTRITLWRPDVEFRDVQETGPYSAWVHTHRFERDGGAVRMHDRVDYALPLGPLGRLVHRLVVRRQLEQIFAHRRRAIEEIFPATRESAAR